MRRSRQWRRGSETADDLPAWWMALSRNSARTAAISKAGTPDPRPRMSNEIDKAKISLDLAMNIFKDEPATLDALRDLPKNWGSIDADRSHVGLDPPT